MTRTRQPNPRLVTIGDVMALLRGKILARPNSDASLALDALVSGCIALKIGKTELAETFFDKGLKRAGYCAKATEEVA